MKRTRIAGLSLALCAALPAAPAQAAFAPVLDVRLDPATAAAPAALAATISQPADAAPIQRFTLTLPAGFKRYGAPDAESCSLAALRVFACPASSQIGTVDGRVGSAVGLSGTIHKGSAERFVVVVYTLGGALRQAVAGSLAKRPDGSLDLELDQLPAIALTSLSFHFDGARKALVRTPAKCGTYSIAGKFTSRQDDLALALTNNEITGCSGVPAIAVSDIRLSRDRLSPGGGRAGFQTAIRWSASRAADHTLVRIERPRKRGGWQVLGSLVAMAREGENVLRWDGRLYGHALPRGRYGVRIQPAGSAPSRIVRFRIV